jgi:hypothetical protein
LGGSDVLQDGRAQAIGEIEVEKEAVKGTDLIQRLLYATGGFDLISQVLCNLSHGTPCGGVIIDDESTKAHASM